ncbi:MAG: substrate-binding domain-containing protein [Ignavibacteriales bacterium]|nr:substrate-binding domain-containing protein [Ignavibacteriales bacterium]
MKRILAVLLFGLSSLLLVGCGGNNQKTASTADSSYTVGFLMETYDLDRWKRDESYFGDKSRSFGMTVLRAVADADQDRQNKQAETLLTQGVNVLVVVPKNLNTAARIVTSAHEKNVPVLAYDRLIVGCDLDMYITFDNEKVGYLQAEGVLQKVPEGNFILLGGAASDNNAKLLREGQLRAIKEHELKTKKKITILADPFLDDWDREEARRRIGNLITKFNAEKKRIDAIIASNDATAGGVVAALQAEKMDRKIPVSGQDAELQACQRIVEGTQAVTVYKPVQLLAEVSAQVAHRLAKKERPEDIIRALGYTVNYLDNGFKKVPSIFLEPVFVTKDNIMKTVVADGWQTVEKIYAGVPKNQWPK